MKTDRWRAGPLACALFLLLLLGGCATSPQTRQLLQEPPDIPPRAELEQVPFFPQLEYHCGPAAMAGILSYHGVAVKPEQIAELIYVPELKGSLQVEVIAAARQFGLLPVQLEGRLDVLLREVAAGNPVFVLQNLGLDLYPVWHYETLIGYDFEKRELILRSGENRRIGRSFKLFEKTWQRAGYWALVLAPPGSIPVSASAESYLEAVIGMEQVGRVDIAHGAYASARERWPQSWLAHSGYGNTAYALGEFSAAESAYRRALALAPERADIWNNLAYSLAQLGRHEASMEAIRRALEIDPQNRNLQDSLNELRNWRLQ